MVSDPRRGAKGPGSDPVSIRFEVRGGFRQQKHSSNVLLKSVSIRFEVRGGFRHDTRTEKGRSKSRFNPL